MVLSLDRIEKNTLYEVCNFLPIMSYFFGCVVFVGRVCKSAGWMDGWMDGWTDG